MFEKIDIYIHIPLVLRFIKKNYILAFHIVSFMQIIYCVHCHSVKLERHLRVK